MAFFFSFFYFHLCKQHVVGSFFFFFRQSLSLIEILSPFKFNIISDIVEFVFCFLFILSLSFWSSFLTLLFLFCFVWIKFPSFPPYLPSFLLSFPFHSFLLLPFLSLFYLIFLLAAYFKKSTLLVYNVYKIKYTYSLASFDKYNHHHLSQDIQYSHNFKCVFLQLIPSSLVPVNH